MQYIGLIYEDEKIASGQTPEQQQASFGKWMAYTEEMKKAGVLVAGDALQPVGTATTVRAKSGDVVTLDGPFAETKEQLGGYYLMECKDLDDALKWAKKCPVVESGGCMEVRPVMVFG